MKINSFKNTQRSSQKKKNTHKDMQSGISMKE